MTKSNEKVTPLVVTDIENALNNERNAKALAVKKACVTRGKAKVKLSKGDVFNLVTSTALDNTPDSYDQLELAGNGIKIDAKLSDDVKRASIKYLQDCVNDAWRLAIADDDLTYYVKENRKSLQNGGLDNIVNGVADIYNQVPMKMLPVKKAPSNKGTGDDKVHKLPSMTGNILEISVNAENNNFFSLDKDSNNQFFIDADLIANMPKAQREKIENLCEDFWQEVHGRIRAKAQKLHYTGYLEVLKKAS
jgi:hypothetical protein